MQMGGFALYTVSSVYYVNEIIPVQDAVKGQSFLGAAGTIGAVAANVLGGALLDASGVPLLLTVCMLLCMLPTVAFASGSDYLKIAMLDSGRKYFSADWVKAFLYEAKADGYTHVMLAVGNDGMRFLLDDMSLTVGGKTYSSNAVASAIRSGNNAYTTASSGEWTESEMDEFFATAKKAGIEIIPLLNSPGHMDSVLYAASSLTGTNCSYNGSAPST